MNLVVMGMEKLLADEKIAGSTACRAMALASRVKSKDQSVQNFALYFVEQSIAMLGTWIQQVVVSWLIHSTPHAVSSMSALSPKWGMALTVLCSGFTWLLLTVWTFKLRERLRHFASVLSALKASVRTTDKLSLLDLLSKGHSPDRIRYPRESKIWNKG
jgi:hypothetical protein